MKQKYLKAILTANGLVMSFQHYPPFIKQQLFEISIKKATDKTVTLLINKDTKEVVKDEEIDIDDKNIIEKKIIIKGKSIPENSANYFFLCPKFYHQEFRYHLGYVNQEIKQFFNVKVSEQKKRNNKKEERKETIEIYESGLENAKRKSRVNKRKKEAKLSTGKKKRTKKTSRCKKNRSHFQVFECEIKRKGMFDVHGKKSKTQKFRNLSF